jgi:hypothetical protein
MVLLRGLSLIALLIGGLCIFTSPVAAHPPSDMAISYNELSRTLSVTITHKVPNPQVHYIREVLVTINGKTVNDSLYSSQPTGTTFTYTYPVDTKTGDEIAVTATCVIGGSATSTLYNTGTLSPMPSGTMADPAPASASTGLFPIIGTSALVLLFRKK